MLLHVSGQQIVIAVPFLSSLASISVSSHGDLIDPSHHLIVSVQCGAIFDQHTSNEFQHSSMNECTLDVHKIICVDVQEYLPITTIDMLSRQYR
jgi:hypothetical protein